MEESGKVILRNLDRPLRIAIFTTDELMAGLLPFSIGCIFGFMITGIILSITCYNILRYLKQNAGEGALKHLMYWYLPGLHRNLEKKVASHVREYIG